MDKNSSILDNLKAQGTPYKVPDGYFDNLRVRLDSIPSALRGEEASAPETVVEMPTFWAKLRPYVALAAAFLILLTAGTAILKTTSGRMNISEEEYFQLASILPVTDPYAIYYDEYAEDDELSGDDIVNYLIETGVSLEQLAYSTSYEENY